ncbi:hypothetical protein [Flavobacterium sp. JP2137]|uniref:hypothetical protein n=1 Tax=Flavobacterium sp. JP2137 TaxID=3414510 RepID=UPI003D2FD01E
MKLLKKNQIQSVIQVCSVLLLFHGVYFKMQPGFTTALSNGHFALFITSLVLITLGGLLLYQLTVQEEKPQLPPLFKIANSNYLYFALTVSGVAIGYYLSHLFGKPSFLAFFILQAVLLYSFITQWRKSFIWSNILYALLLIFPVLGLALFDLIPQLNLRNYALSLLNFSFTVDFAIMLFLLFMLQSGIQDILFRPSDYMDHKKTIAVKYGSKIAAKTTAVLALITAAIVLGYTLLYLSIHSSLFLYILLLIIAPLLYCAFELWQAKTRSSIQTVRIVLQITIWTSILSIAVLTYNLTTYVAS